MIIIIICTLLAATAGPSSATLLIPREDLWALESANMQLNGNFASLWPSVLSAEDVPASCGFLTFDSSPTDPQCLVNDWIPEIKSSNPLFDVTDDGDDDYYHGMDAIYLQNSNLPYEKMMGSCLCSSAWSDQYCATTPQEVFYPSIASIETFDNEPSSYIDSYNVIQDNYYQPYTIASCLSNKVNNAWDQKPVQFARLLQNSSELQQNRSRDIVTISNMTIQQALSLPGNISEYRVAWIDLSQELFDIQVPGVLFVHPQNPDNATEITTCTPNAGWGSSKLTAHVGDGSDAFSCRANNPIGWPPELVQVIDVAGVVQEGKPDFANLSGYAYPEKRIHITQDWAKLLNPVLQLSPAQNTTFLSAALLSMGDQVPESIFARLTSTLLASGLARTGLVTQVNSR